jgi:hypothetical protein
LDIDMVGVRHFWSAREISVRFVPDDRSLRMDVALAKAQESSSAMSRETRLAINFQLRPSSDSRWARFPTDKSEMAIDNIVATLSVAGGSVSAI